MAVQATRRDIGLVPFGIVLAAGLIISSHIAAKAVVRVKLANQTITVKGYAEKPITSDRGTWYGSFSTRSEDLTAAYEKLQADLEKVLAYLEKSGVDVDYVKVSSVNTATLYRKTDEGRDTNEIEGYRLSRSVSLATTDVLLISKIANESTALIKDGVEFYSGYPSFIYTKIEDLKIEMLAAATQDARRRAETLATNSGSKVGPLRSASQGVFQITPAFSTDVSDYGRYDTSTIDKTIKAVVTVQYSIE